jgi:hypothetical protein
MMNKPRHIDPLAEKVLSLLAGKPEASEIILGGYFALQHYVDYRTTHDINAWWKTRSVPAAELAIHNAMTNVADGEGLQLQERRFGETISFELVRDGKRIFSFQIAVRSVPLDQPCPSAWPPVLLETLPDNIGSKMNALVDRGTPRDFTDIKTVADSGLMAPHDCWRLWQLKNPGLPLDQAKQKVLIHLSALEARRPLDAIRDPAEKGRASSTRDWFKQEFLKP